MPKTHLGFSFDTNIFIVGGGGRLGGKLLFWVWVQYYIYAHYSYMSQNDFRVGVSIYRKRVLPKD